MLILLLTIVIILLMLVGLYLYSYYFVLRLLFIIPTGVCVIACILYNGFV